MPTAPIARPDSGSGTASGMPTSGVHSGSCVRTARAIGWSSARSTGSGPYVRARRRARAGRPAAGRPRHRSRPAPAPARGRRRRRRPGGSPRTVRRRGGRTPRPSAGPAARPPACRPSAVPGHTGRRGPWRSRAPRVPRRAGCGEAGDRDPEAVPAHSQRQAREPRVAVLLQRGPLRRVPVAPLDVVGSRTCSAGTPHPSRDCRRRAACAASARGSRPASSASPGPAAHRRAAPRPQPTRRRAAAAAA